MAIYKITMKRWTHCFALSEVSWFRSNVLGFMLKIKVDVDGKPIYCSLNIFRLNDL